ncbi:glycosyltransferase [Bizionia myxarmorum]|uniref:Glycosyltransferase n=1 Tax=Bizionia myxarmorum TaxID=291186 RepID=A0A5D0RE36_9FLAO|nr:glycosyltransferase [Bizionia myxarmorum]TYB79025.1 glycosyltransferase [Bizionia myxarmorum]
MLEAKHILVAPLNWGLGHATRCIPIINALIEHNLTPILASDGAALALLKNEFPELIALELPSYAITYAKKAAFLKYKLLKDTPRILKTMAAEKVATAKILANYPIIGIISDNRFGVYAAEVPSVYITHQLQVLSGNTTWLSTKIHAAVMEKFDQCWVPDTSESINLSGKLGHLKKFKSQIKYIGALSRFEKKDLPIVYDIMVLLSGPEPQRQYLEINLLEELKNFKGSVVFVKGVVETKITKEVTGNMTLYNFLTSDLLETAINQSQLIISRSGYTTIMDLAKLEKQAFFIPTPGQLEQQYLAKRLQDQGLVPFCEQDDFTLEKLKRVSDYKGLSHTKASINYDDLFSLFHTE